jgi:hypothetical protein
MTSIPWLTTTAVCKRASLSSQQVEYVCKVADRLSTRRAVAAAAALANCSFAVSAGAAQQTVNAARALSGSGSGTNFCKFVRGARRPRRPAGTEAKEVEYVLSVTFDDAAARSPPTRRRRRTKAGTSPRGWLSFYFRRPLYERPFAQRCANVAQTSRKRCANLA